MIGVSTVKSNIKRDCKWALSLFPNEDILTKEIQSWRAFADSLHADNRELFMSMLNGCYKYAAAINVKRHTFAAEPLIMTLLLSQNKITDRLRTSFKA